MNELFLQTPYGNLMMDRETAKKYHLEKGSRSPFTGELVVDENGDSAPVPKNAKYNNRTGDDDNTGDSSRIFTTAEILDIAQGADSSDG